MTPAETERQAMEAAFARVFHGMPPAKERANMSPENLALELAKHQNDSPAYILLSHELNLRLAKEQAKATLSAGWLGASATLIAALATFFLGLFIGTSQQSKELSEPKSEKTSSSNLRQQENKTTEAVPRLANSNPPATPLSGTNSQKAAQSANGKPSP